MEEKYYIFSYDSMQDPIFFENLFAKDTKRMAATLNGYVKCVDESRYFLLKKDLSSQVRGTVFEISKDELFMVDRWKMFPQYQRFTANVLLNDKNEILENVYVYTKLELGKYYVATEDMGFFKDPSASEDNLRAFIELEKQAKKLPISDAVFLYEIDEKTHELIRNFTHPYTALILEDKENKLFSIQSCALFAINEKNKHYAALTSFGNKVGMNSIMYYEVFNDKIPNSHSEITIKPLYDLDLSFLEGKKPNYYLSHREDKEEKNGKMGWYKDVAFELVTPDFNLDPMLRFDQLLTAFFQSIK
ncbi:gamma-glutamylcyclotransferase [Mycoplasma phocoeninasale]|uniref:Gamma-glutamylcyclotransferase n=1 Tax=Mycoplasma phocoeninasale TaxID=2726117 RepID=A0A858U2Q0_9MOLU|nr:gamma-glutamylcyclotransferase family protein [Mycoplasma phocoeninasale]QJG66231.1 gamma-glutamylcyclotransferase [Mycoplasma phocoeninasale]